MPGESKRRQRGIVQAGSAPEMTITLGVATAQYALAMTDYRATYAGTPGTPVAAAVCREAASGSTIGLLERQLRRVSSLPCGCHMHELRSATDTVIGFSRFAVAHVACIPHRKCVSGIIWMCIHARTALH